jgi:hypothetical protein
MFVATSNCAKKRLANSRYVWTIENWMHKPIKICVHCHLGLKYVQFWNLLVSMEKGIYDMHIFWAFYKVGTWFHGVDKLVAWYTNNQYILLAINYINKWVEIKPLCDNSATNIINSYEHIITCFGCPTNMVNDQHNHFL